jgi:hypothetical protein
MLQAALEAIPVKDMAELDHLDPGSRPKKPGLKALLGGIGGLLGWTR